MQTTMIVDENIRLKGFNLIVSETEFLILSIALSRMADSKYVNDKDRVIAERMHNDLYEVGADMAGVPQTDLVQDSPNLVKDLVEDYEPYEYEIKAWHKEHQEPYCEQADTPQTDCPFKDVPCSCGEQDECEWHTELDTPQTKHYDYSKSEMENIKCGNGITTEIPQNERSE